MIKIGVLSMMSARRRKKKVARVIVPLVVLLIIGVAGFLIWQNNSTSNEGEDAATNQEKVNTTEKSENISEEKENTNQVEEETEKKKVEQYDGEDPNNNNELSGAITYAGVNGGTLMIRVNIDQYLSGGSCNLVLSKNGATIYSDTANIIDNVSTATCEGFDVPVDKLGGGKIEIKIDLQADGKNGVINGEVNV